MPFERRVFMTVDRINAPPPPTPFAQELCALLPDLHRKALALTRNASLADDLVQDTVERALVHQAQFRDGSNLRAWVSRIMTNRFISQARRRGTERRVLGTAAQDPNGWASWQPSVQVHQLTPKVAQVLDDLPARLRTAVRIVDLEDGSYRDAAEALDVPLGTVMSRLHRGRARLRERLVGQQRGSLASPVAA
jgi:RNA polymerase sigma-70 factor (ECF subfamily)